MTEADPLCAHDPVDDAAAGRARPEAVPQVLLRADDEGWLVVVVERAKPEQVGTVAAQLDPDAGDEALQRDLRL